MDQSVSAIRAQETAVHRGLTRRIGVPRDRAEKSVIRKNIFFFFFISRLKKSFSYFNLQNDFSGVLEKKAHFQGAAPNAASLSVSCGLGWVNSDNRVEFCS